MSDLTMGIEHHRSILASTPVVVENDAQHLPALVRVHIYHIRLAVNCLDLLSRVCAATRTMSSTKAHIRTCSLLGTNLRYPTFALAVLDNHTGPLTSTATACFRSLRHRHK